MSDLKRLDEALGQWTDYRVKRDLVPILDPVETEALLAVFTAARAYRDRLAKGQRVEPDYEAAARAMELNLGGDMPRVPWRDIQIAALDPTTEEEER